MRRITLIEYHSVVDSTKLFVRRWRVAQKKSVDQVAGQAGLSVRDLEAIEEADQDCRLATIDCLAQALGIPAAWLYADPSHFEMLFQSDEEVDAPLQDLFNRIDPIVERIVRASGHERSLFVLLTALLQSGDTKLVRAAEMSLKSLLKQARPTTAPWQSRPSGHFEPPSD